MENYDLKIFTDTDCDIYIDGSFVVNLTRGSIYKTTLCEGDYIIQAKTVNPAVVYRNTYTLSKNAVLEISFEAMFRDSKALINHINLHPFLAYGAGLYGFMDKKSRAVVIPAVYDKVHPFNYKGLAIVEKDGMYGMINKFGEVVIPFEYNNLTIPTPKGESRGSSIDYYVLSGEKGDGVLDASGKWRLMPDEGYRLETIHSKKSRYSFSHFFIFVNTLREKQIFNGEKFITTQSFAQVNIYEDVIVVKMKSEDTKSYHYGVMDHNGFIHMSGFDYISGFQNGYAWAEMGDKAGWINKFGLFAFIPDRELDRYGPFDGKLALVRKGDKVGFIDKNKTTVIPFVYDAASPFTEDRAIVSKNGLIGMIDSTGKEVCPCVYEAFSKPNCMSFPLAIVQKDGKYGCINKDGELKVPCMYNELWLVEEDFIAVKNEENKWGFVNSKNEQVIPFEYDRLSRRGCHQYNTKSYFWDTASSCCFCSLTGEVPISAPPIFSIGNG
jgi:hypothetical protein